MSVKKHLENFAANTSMHGFGKIILAKKPEKRAAWLIVFVAAWTLFGAQLYSVVSSYLTYSKKTTNEFIPGGAPFPSITLCNMQSIDFYTLHLLHTTTMDYYESLRSGVQNVSFSEFIQQNDTLAYEIAKLEDLITKSVMKEPPGLTADQFFKLYSRTTIAANLKQAVLKEGLVKEDEFIVKCTYGNSKCNFKAIDHPYYYRCFTFEPPHLLNRSAKELDSLAEGIANGFSVTLFTGTKLIDSKEFKDSLISGIYERGSPLSGSSGIRMTIHPPGTIPFPLTEGFDVPTGYLASIGIVPQRRTRLGPPYGKCATKNKYHKNYMELLNLTESNRHRPYRKISCERACMQKHVIKECDCYDPFLPNTGDAFCKDGKCFLIKNKDKNADESSTETFENAEALPMFTCRSINYLEMGDDNRTGVQMLLERIRCAENVTNRLMTVVSDLEACGCHPPCDEFHYGASYSLSRWPSMGYESSFVYFDIFKLDKFPERFPEEKRKVYSEYVEKEGVFALKDFAKVNVYVSDSNVLRTTEHPATTLTQLVSDVGGQLGLWIGVSVITISEILETILKIITGALRKICRRAVVRDGSETDAADKASNPDSPESV